MAEKPKTFQRRTGVGGFPRWRGVVTEGRPSAIGLDRLRDAINVRLGDEITSRGGQEKVNTNAVDECIYGIFDAQAEDVGGDAKLWIAGGDAGGATPFSLASYHPDDDPTFQNLIANANTIEGVPLFNRDGFVWFGDVPASGTRRICQLVRFTPPAGDEGLESGGYSFVPRFSVNGYSAETDLLSGITYIGGYDGADGKVWSWNGTTLTLDSGAVFAQKAPLIIPFREDVYGASTHLFRKRAAGAWTSISMPGALTSFVPNDWAVYKDVLYIVGRDHVGGNNDVAKILSFDGTTLTVVRTPESSGFDSFGVGTCTSIYGYLYFAWKRASDSSLILGQFDGSTWTDTHKDMSAAGVGSLVRWGYDMIPFREDLYMLVKEDTPTATVRLIRSDGSSTSSAWTIVHNFGNVTTLTVGVGNWLMEF